MNVIPMLKVNAATRMVHARIDETPDSAGEVLDYASCAPLYRAWSDEMVKASDGKSLGNVRAMHGLKAAGRVVSIDFDDAARAIDLAIEVVDDDEWTKVEKGVYTGVSPGGRFLRKWNDGKHKRYTAAPREISLVDTPCIPSAGFTMMKLDGGEEIVAFAEPSLAAQAALLAARLENVDGVEDYRAILAEASEDLLKMAFPDGVPEQLAPAADPAAISGGEMIKGLGTVSWLADLLSSLRCMAESVVGEAATEADGSALPAAMRDWLTQGIALLKQMVTEETAEAMQQLDTSVAMLPQLTIVIDDAADMAKMADSLSDMVKAGARNSASDQQVIQTIHDHACALGAACAAPEDMAKIGYLPALARHVGDAAILRDEMKKVVQDRDMLKLRVTELEALPRPGGPVLRAVDRAQDGTGGGQPVVTREQRRAEIDAMPPGTDRAVAEARFAMQFR